MKNILKIGLLSLLCISSVNASDFNEEEPPKKKRVINFNNRQNLFYNEDGSEKTLTAKPKNQRQAHQPYINQLVHEYLVSQNDRER